MSVRYYRASLLLWPVLKVQTKSKKRSEAYFSEQGILLPRSDSTPSDLGTGDFRLPAPAFFSTLLPSFVLLSDTSRSLDHSFSADFPSILLFSSFLSSFLLSFSTLGVFSLLSMGFSSFSLSFPPALASGVLPGFFSFFSFFSFVVFSLSSFSLLPLVLWRDQGSTKSLLELNFCYYISGFEIMSKTYGFYSETQNNFDKLEIDTTDTMWPSVKSRLKSQSN